MYCKTLVLLPSRKTLADLPEFAKDPAYAGFIRSFPFSIVSPYLAYAGWGGKLDSEGVPLFQQALVGKLTAREFLDKFAEVLSKNMSYAPWPGKRLSRGRWRGRSCRRAHRCSCRAPYN